MMEHLCDGCGETKKCRRLVETTGVAIQEGKWHLCDDCLNKALNKSWINIDEKQPIEYLKNGNEYRYLVYDDGAYYICTFHGDKWDSYEGCFDIENTWWQPLPKPPSEAE